MKTLKLTNTLLSITVGAQLIAPFTHLLMGGQNAVHRPPVTQVLPFVQQGCIHFPGSKILEPLAVEGLAHRILLGLG